MFLSHPIPPFMVSDVTSELRNWQVESWDYKSYVFIQKSPIQNLFVHLLYIFVLFRNKHLLRLWYYYIF